MRHRARHLGLGMLAIASLTWSTHAIVFEATAARATTAAPPPVPPVCNGLTAKDCERYLNDIVESKYGGTGGSFTTYPTGFTPPSGYAAKLEKAQLMEADVAINLSNNAASADPSTSVNCPDGCPPAARNMSPWSWEAQSQWWNCGPGSVRNALLAIVGGGAPSQDTLGDSAAYDMHTNATHSTDELDAPARALDHYQSVNPYYHQPPGSPTQLLTWVTDDVAYYNAPVVENVATADLPWFHNHTWPHYDLIFGYDSSRGGHLSVLENYDGPSWRYNGEGTVPDSWGPHYSVSLATIYSAVKDGPSGTVTW